MKRAPFALALLLLPACAPPDPNAARKERERAEHVRAAVEAWNPVSVRSTQEIHGYFNDVDCGIVAWRVWGTTAAGAPVRLRVSPDSLTDVAGARQLWLATDGRDLTIAKAR